MKNAFLVIEFHDNDFSKDFTDGLTRFYQDCKQDNLFKGEFDASERLIEINKAGLLHPILLNYIIGASYMNRAEHPVRFFDHDNFKQFIQADSFGVKIDHTHYQNYLSGFKIKFYKNEKAFHEWQNGEHCALNLHTGYVFSY